MAYIYLEELKKILPGILDQWIDKDDESWEWIFQEIEQKCHIGTKRKGKKWKKYIEDDIYQLKLMVDTHSTVLSAHRNDINELNKKISELKKQICIMGCKITIASDNAKEAKFAAQTAKQRTEVDYSKYSGKSDGKISYCNPEDKDCKTCRHYCDTEIIKEPCITCNTYEHWEVCNNGTT